MVALLAAARPAGANMISAYFHPPAFGIFLFVIIVIGEAYLYRLLLQKAVPMTLPAALLLSLTANLFSAFVLNGASPRLWLGKGNGVVRIHQRIIARDRVRIEAEQRAMGQMSAEERQAAQQEIARLHQDIARSQDVIAALGRWRAGIGGILIVGQPGWWSASVLAVIWSIAYLLTVVKEWLVVALFSRWQAKRWNGIACLRAVVLANLASYAFYFVTYLMAAPHFRGW
jgi:hypothetical protein